VGEEGNLSLEVKNLTLIAKNWMENFTLRSAKSEVRKFPSWTSNAERTQGVPQYLIHNSFVLFLYIINRYIILSEKNLDSTYS